MWIIAIAAVLGVVLLAASGAVPNSSVGGPLTLALAFLIATLAVGIHEAWTKRRGVLGWIGSIVAAVVGGMAGAGIGGSALMSLVLVLVDLEGSLASTRHPALYVMLAGQMLCAMLGSWLALQIVNRFR